MIWLFPYDFASTYTTPITSPHQPLSRTSAGIVAVICWEIWIIKGRGKRRQATQKRKILLDLFCSIWSILFYYNFNSTYTTPITPPPQPLSCASAGVVAVVIIAIAIIIVHPMVDCYLNCLRDITLWNCSNRCAFYEIKIFAIVRVVIIVAVVVIVFPCLIVI